MQIEPYLFFDGLCEEALAFYKTALGAEVEALLRFKDNPDPPSPGMVPPGSENKVMHTRIRIGDTTLMASDGRCLGKPSFQGFSLTLNVPDATEAERLFAVLGEGGQVQMPLSKTFFSPRFGMVADRFGIGWMILAADAAANQAQTNDATDTQGKPFVITRVFDAPRHLVWQAWTEAERLEKWWGPKGCKIGISKLEFRPGGLFHYVMRYSSGAEMWGRFFYRDIAPPERIVWLNSFSNANGGITRAPFSPICPLEMLNTMTLTEAGEKTALTLRSTAHGATDEERKYFEDLTGSLSKGFGGTFDQLADYLARA